MSLVDAFWSAPPVTRTWAVLVFMESLALHSGLLGGYRVGFAPFLLFKFPPEIWRLVTAFCITSGIGILFDPYMIWTNAGWLERECMRFSADPGSFLVYTVSVGFLTLLINSSLWGSTVFTHPLIMAVVYTWCLENRGRQTNVYFVTLDARYVWPTFLFLTFLMSGWQAFFEDLGGVIAAHCYDFLTIYWPKYGKGRNIIVTPGFVRACFVGEARTINVPVGQVFRPRNEHRTGTSTGFSSWNSRGSGRRLGGD